MMAIVCNYPGNTRLGQPCAVMYCNGLHWQCQGPDCPATAPTPGGACMGDAPQACFYDIMSRGHYCSCQSSKWVCS
jgi:hypothetical protein